MTSPQSQPIKVCMLVLQHPFLDARIFKREAKSLVKLGYDVTMVVPRNKEGLMYDIDGTPFRDEFIEPVFYHEGVRIVSYKARMPLPDHMEKALSATDHNLFNDPLFRKGLEQKADIYHAHEFHSLYSGIGIKRALQATTGKSVKLIYDSHEITEGVKVPLMMRMLLDTDYVITVSDAMKSWYKKAMPSLPVEILYNSPPLAKEYVPKTTYDDSFVACYEGYILKDKGSSEKLFEITEHCKEQFPFHFKILGGTAGQNITIPDKLDQHISLYGWVHYNRIPHYLKDVDVGWIDYNLNSTDTPINFRMALPNKFFSYLNNGIPVVVNQCPEMAYFVRTFQCGIVVDHPNPDGRQYADAFTFLHENREAWLEMSRNARAMMRDRYCWEHMENRLKLVYQALIEQARA